MKAIKRTKSLVAIAAGMCLAGVVMAQSTTGTISGSAKPGTTIVMTNSSGFTRTITADANGRFSAGQLPIGEYTVEAKGLGTRSTTVTVGGNAGVSFENNLETVTVTGTRATIDTSTVDSRTVMTAKELSRLPINQSAQGIALLSPGANAGAGGYFGGLTSFGGAGVSENAYYVNGYFSGEPLSNLGGLELPYGAIAQQETYTGGYSAKYGRSDGGVINQVGKSGTNKWEFGGQISVSPKSLRSSRDDIYYPNLKLPTGYVYETVDDPATPNINEAKAGQLYQRQSFNEASNTKYSFYAGGPIIQDKLFAFVALEQSHTKTITAPLDGVAYDTHQTTKDPKAYLKLNWNISDDHLLEYTYLGERKDISGSRYYFEPATSTEGALHPTVPTPQKLNSSYNILTYTGYLSDNLTLSATYGQSKYHNQQINPTILPGVPLLGSVTLQNPAYNNGTPIPNIQGDYQAHDGRDGSKGLRVDLAYKLGSHDLSVGIDNIKFNADNEGTSQVADRYIFGRTAGNISASLGVGSPVSATNPNGYYVRQYFYSNNTDMTLDQKAWYVEDKWNVTKNFLLSLGLRNDRFTNRNNAGEAYMDAKNQWAPRLGASWDVMGDNSLKVFGNGGRYFLALPNNVAIRGASASILASQYYTYTGLSSTGVPTGLTPVPAIGGGASGLVSSNLELGQPVDVQAFAPNDLKNMYQDEFILGFEKAIAKGWTAGAKLTHRALKSAVDDFCDPASLAAAAGLEYLGADYAAKQNVAVDANGKKYAMASCYMFNPGGANTYSFAALDGSGRLTKKISAADLGFQQGLKRKYQSLDLFLERAFDNVWSMRVDYTYSKLRGNTEGQVKSEFGQDNISKTQDWDAWQMMQYADGALANDRKHQLKIRGNYQFAKEWLVSANARILSGTPINCLGFFNPGNIDENSEAADPIAYGASYHTCFGKVAEQGVVRTPWTRQLDMGLQYRPDALQGKLALTVNVFNLLNAKKTTQVNVTSETDPYTVSNTYLVPLSQQTPRVWQFQVSYDY